MKLILLTLVLLPVAVWSQCSCSLPLNSNSLERTSSDHHWTLGLQYEYQHSNQLFLDGSEVDSSELTRLHRETLSITRHLSDEWSLGVNLRWIEGEHSGDHPSVNISGFGDLDLLAEWRPVKGLRFTIGASLPTGDDAATTLEEAGILQILQLGDGSVAPIGGINYETDISDHFGVFGGATGHFPTAESSLGVRYGISVISQAGFKVHLTPKLQFRGSLDVLWRGRAYLDGDIIDGTGGTTVALTPAISYQITDALTFNAFARLPVSQSVKGAEQLAPGVHVGAGLRYSF